MSTSVQYKKKIKSRISKGPDATRGQGPAEKSGVKGRAAVGLCRDRAVCWCDQLGDGHWLG